MGRPVRVRVSPPVPALIFLTLKQAQSFMTNKTLFGYSIDDLQTLLKSLGEPAFRAKQIHQWIYQKFVSNFEGMRNVPAKTRQTLIDNGYTVSPLIVHQEYKSKDGSIKFVLRCEDGELLETVYMPGSKRRTVCISSQIGCPVKCSFCASGKNGLKRNLKPEEIAGQILFIANRFGQLPTNIVAMGMGEPLLNPHFIPALNILTGDEFLNIGARNITVSTSGIVPGIETLANCQSQWNLAVSIHAPVDELRAEIIPDQFRYPLQEIIEACRLYREKTTRKVTFEYTLVKGHNDAVEMAEKLAKLAKSVDAKINLIPLNCTDLEERKPGSKDIASFIGILEKMRVVATVRSSKGDDIAAACGQLRNVLNENQ